MSFVSRSVKIAPSLLASDFAHLKSEMDRVTEAGADWHHVDVMDGHFVPNLTVGIPVVAALKKYSRIPLDVHLMIERPERFIEDFVKAGSDYLTIHVESTDRVAECLTEIRALGAKAGLTLKPGTPVQSLEPYLHLVDLVLVMTVEPGFGGQSFREDQVTKIRYLFEKRSELNLKYLIEVDGGITDKTCQKVLGADVLVAGSFIFQGEARSNIQSLRTQYSLGK